MDEHAGRMLPDVAYLQVGDNCYSTTGKCSRRTRSPNIAPRSSG